MTKGILLANKHKSKSKSKSKNKKGTAAKYMENTAQIDIKYLEGRTRGVWGARIIYPRGGYDTATTIMPQQTIRETVAEVCKIIKESMRETKAEYTELLFKMPQGATHKLFIYYKDIERDDILNNEIHRDGDMNAYD